MYCRNQYYQPYKARRKSSNDQEGKTEELEEQDSQQVTSSTTTQENISSNKGSLCRLSLILKCVIFLIILLSASGGMISWFLNHSEEAGEIMNDAINNVASKIVIENKEERTNTGWEKPKDNESISDDNNVTDTLNEELKTYLADMKLEGHAHNYNDAQDNTDGVAENEVFENKKIDNEETKEKQMSLVYDLINNSLNHHSDRTIDVETIHTTEASTQTSKENPNKTTTENIIVNEYITATQRSFTTSNMSSISNTTVTQADLESVTETGQDVFNTTSIAVFTAIPSENIKVIEERGEQEEESEHKEETSQGHHIDTTTTANEYLIKIPATTTTANEYLIKIPTTTTRPKNVLKKQNIEDESPKIKNKTDNIISTNKSVSEPNERMSGENFELHHDRLGENREEDERPEIKHMTVQINSVQKSEEKANVLLSEEGSNDPLFEIPTYTVTNPHNSGRYKVSSSFW